MAMGTAKVEDVPSVRSKLGLSDADCTSTWRLLNTTAQNVCARRYGLEFVKPFTDTLEAIAELKEYFTSNKSNYGEITFGKITDALCVPGAAAWLIHNARKRNHDKYKHSLKRKGAIERLSATPLDPSDSNPTVNEQLDVGTGTARSSMWDPARNCYT